MDNPFKIIVDPSVPADTIIIRGEYEEIRIINVKIPEAPKTTTSQDRF